MRSLSPVTALVLAGVLAVPAQAGSDPFEFFADGAGAIEIEGDGEVPLLRGVDTDGRPAVLAQGEEKDEPDEFILHMRMLSGANHCTEPVAKALGGEIREFTVGRQKKGGALSPTIKTVTKGAVIPELRLKGEKGAIVIKDWHCEVHAKDNALSVMTLDEAVVAQLTDRGVFAFAKPEMADKLMSKVGKPMEGIAYAGSPIYENGTLLTSIGTHLIVEGQVLGKPGYITFSNDGTPSRVAGPLVQAEVVGQAGGAQRAIGAVSVGDVSIRERGGYLIYDSVFATAYDDKPEDDTQVHVELAAVDYADLAIAVNPAEFQVAFKKVDKAVWKDPTDKFIDDAKKAFDKAGGGSATLLAPAAEGRIAMLVDAAPMCDSYELVDYSSLTIDGVRAYGAAARELRPSESCDAPIARAEEGDGPDTGAGEAAASGSEDKKEAKRLADYADVLWKHGRFEEAFNLYDKAQGMAGEDCSYFEDFAKKAMRMGKTDKALDAARRSAELYEPWAAQDLEVRLAVQAKEEVPDGTIMTPQAHDCAQARGYEAMANLAKGSHKRIEKAYTDHMDLDEQIPMALSLSRLQRGQSTRARGPAIEALNVGARGTAMGHLVHGAAVAQWGSERLLQSNLDRILSLGSDLRAGELLVGAAMARQSTDGEALKTFTKRAITERPDSAGSWTVHGLEGLRRGDAAAVAEVKAVAAEVAQDEIDSAAGLAWSYCEAASLLFVAGDAAGGEAFLKQAEGKGRPGASCLVTQVVKSAVAGDTEGNAKALNDLAVRFPLHPLGTLNLVSPVAAEAAE